MARDTGRDRKEGTAPKPSLETLINAIDQKVDQVPTLSTAEEFAALLGGEAEDYQRQIEHYVRFEIGEAAFALPLKNALEIDYAPEIVPLPNIPQWVLGICNLRGDIVSVVDIKQILNLVSEEKDTVKKLVLLKHQGVSAAIIVDHISGMLFADDQHKENDLNTMDKKPFFKFVKDVLVSDRQTVHLLDMDALMAAIKI